MRVGADDHVQLRLDHPENGLRPSVACLFRSVAKAYDLCAVGMLLTVMGKDGAWEWKLKEQRAVRSSVVFGFSSASRTSGLVHLRSAGACCPRQNYFSSFRNRQSTRKVPLRTCISERAAESFPIW
jgi:hypothetical protein